MSLLLASGSGPQPTNNLAIFYAAMFAARLAAPAEELPPQPAPPTLHQYRQAFQTVGQPWLLSWKSTRQVVADDSFLSLTTYDAYSKANTVGQPWSLTYWKSTRQAVEAEAYDVRSAPPDLHHFRQSFQTVGQTWALWQQPRPQVVAEDYSPNRAPPYIQPTPTVTATPGAPWNLLWWTSTRQQQDAEPFEVRSPAPTIHQWRTGFQTVGQDWQLLYWQSKRQVVADDSFLSITTLDAYSTQNTVGQPWFLTYWNSTRQAVEAESYEVRTPAPFPRQIVTAAVTASTPWFIWQQPRSFSEDEWPYQRFNHSQLFQYIQPWVSVAFYGTYILDLNDDVWQDPWRLPKPVDLLPFRQPTPSSNAGQPWNLLWWSSTRQAVEAEDYTVRTPAPTVDLWRQSFQTVGQPWTQLYWKSTTQVIADDVFIVGTSYHVYTTQPSSYSAPFQLLYWQSRTGQEPEAYEVRTPVPTIHQWRTGYQTVGQPWSLLWPTPRPRPEAEEYEARRPSLYQQYTPILLPGPPWNLLWWQSTREQQQAESYEVRTPYPGQAFHLTKGGRDIWTETFLVVNAGLIVSPSVVWRTTNVAPYDIYYVGNPASGTQQPMNTPILLTASAGPVILHDMTTVPNIIGLQRYQAQEAMRVAQLVYGNPTYVAGSPSTYVSAQTPAAGTVVPTGSTMTWSVYL